MKANPRLLGRLALLMVTTVAFSAGAFETVVIDAGHGGNDEGTKWRHVSEKELTLSVAQRVEKILREKHIQTVMTRYCDSFVSLDERAEVANRYPESLLLSIHFNASRAFEASGFEVYAFRESPSSRAVAEAIHDALEENPKTRDRGVRTNQDYAVLVRSAGSAVLVECGYISNKFEAARLSSPEGQQDLAEALARGVMRIKPLINTDPPEAELAKCEIYERKHEEALRKTEIAEKKPDPPKKISTTTSGKHGKTKKKSKGTKST